MCTQQMLRNGFQAIFSASVAASLAGTAVLTAFWVANALVFAYWQIEIGQMRPMELFGFLLGAPFIFLLVMIVSLFITLPISAGAMLFLYPLLRALRVDNRNMFVLFGFVLGTLVGLYFVVVGNAKLLDWLAIELIAGSAGTAGGLALARQLKKEPIHCGMSTNAAL